MKATNLAVRKLNRRERGVVAVELALMTIPMVLMVLAAIDFARGIYHYNIIVKATRDAVRILTAFDPSVPSEYPTDLARTRVVYGQDNASGSKLLPGLNNGIVQICDRTGSAGCAGTFANVASGSGSINLVRVEVDGYQFQPLFGTGVLPSVTFGPIGTTMLAIR